MPGKKQNTKIEKLVSNQPKVARFQDTLLVNSWGIAVNDFDKTIWVANNGTSTITHYNSKGEKLTPNSIAIPDLNNAKSHPTGIVINHTQGFVIGPSVSNAASSFLITATENGAVYGYNSLVSTNNMFLGVDNSSTGAVYKGLTLANNYIYLADFFNKKITALNFKFLPPVFIPYSVPGYAFIDGDIKNPIPSDYAPFNIAFINGRFYVAYAKQNPSNKKEDQPGPGNGYINVFDFDGTFVKRLVSRGHLNSPWAMMVAPSKLKKFKNQLLVGNFGDGQINAYNFDGIYLGTLDVHIDGLWGLANLDESIYIASGPDDETNGLMGKIIKKAKKSESDSGCD